jgi:hypothetical protein
LMMSHAKSAPVIIPAMIRIGCVEGFRIRNSLKSPSTALPTSLKP